LLMLIQGKHGKAEKLRNGRVWHGGGGGDSGACLYLRVIFVFRRLP
jgi:hypothetical protein